MKRAVVLVSGGIDSATVLALCVRDGCEAYALSFDYGQRHRREIMAAEKIAMAFGARRHCVANIDLRIFGGSALTDEIPVPKSRSPEELSSQVPLTYVPARNTIFLSYALAWAEVLDTRDIFIGVNAVDYSGYPDCRPEFIAAFEDLARLATKAGTEGKQFHIHTPLISMSKADIIRKAKELGVDLSITHSCYDPTDQGFACGQCDSCQLRLKGFREAGWEDPIRYAQG
jgi:7-cyano-7-deazaguanine synthase